MLKKLPLFYLSLNKMSSMRIPCVRVEMSQMFHDLANEEFDQLIDQYIGRSAQWDGTLPLDTVLETWNEIEHRKEPLRVRVRLIDGQFVLDAPPESPLVVREPHTLVLEDGSELTLEFEEMSTEPA
jgi:hypothetical protein